MRRFIIGAASASIAVLAACTDNGANSLSPIGSPAYGVSHVLAGANVPQGTVGFITRGTTTPSDSVNATFRGLDSLEGGFRYVTWLGDSAGTFKQATGLLITTKSDTVLNSAGEPAIVVRVDTVGTLSTFQGKGPRVSMNFISAPANNGLAAADSKAVFLITIEGAANPTAPSLDRGSLFARRAANNATVRLNFGNYTPNVLTQYVYGTAGRGRIYVRDDVLEVSDSSLSRPPKGYFYGVYGVKRNAQNAAVDTIYFGPLRSPFPRRDLSLREADTSIVDPIVQPNSAQFANGFSTSIIAGGIYVHSKDVAETASATTNPYAGIAQILLTLESKYKTDARLGPSFVLTADLPGVVRTPPVTTPASTSLAH